MIFCVIVFVNTSTFIYMFIRPSPCCQEREKYKVIINIVKLRMIDVLEKRIGAFEKEWGRMLLKDKNCFKFWIITSRNKTENWVSCVILRKSVSPGLYEVENMFKDSNLPFYTFISSTSKYNLLTKILNWLF